MDTMKCLIGGLPDTGKSTFLGALWYNLRNCSTSISMKLQSDDNLPDDITLLEKFSDNWIKLVKFDRTNSNTSDLVEINLVEPNTEKKIKLGIPDFLGETFQDIIEGKRNSTLEKWCEEADTLLYFIHDVSPGRFDDDFEKNDDDENTKQIEIPPFTVNKMSEAAKNIMILKYLSEMKKFKKVIIALSWWDVIIKGGGVPGNPVEYLLSNSPALYYNLYERFKHVDIIGVSAQGESYPEKGVSDDEIREFKQRMTKLTLSGERAFVKKNNDIFYDLSLPIYDLINA